MKTLLVAAGLSLVLAGTPQPWVYNETSQSWQTTADWVVGGNFVPSTAVNQLEMWQLDTWDEETIDRELGFAASLGMNVMRVFLHDLMWKHDSKSFLETTDKFLDIAAKHEIGILFVFFDSCWNAYPQLGPQPEPIPYRHNSQWLQSPGIDIVQNAEEFPKLEEYVSGVLNHYKSDSRIIGWDLWNEPDSGGGYDPEQMEPLLSQVFQWARKVSPSQPLTSCLFHFGPWDDYDGLTVLEQLCISESDIISFHNYGDLDELKMMVESIQGYGKPLLCTEYMARSENSTFDPNLGYFKQQHISAINWGVVSGRTQTIYPWDSKNEPNPYEGIDDPTPWFHDIFRSDGTPRYEDEAEYIQSLTGVKFKKA